MAGDYRRRAERTPSRPRSERRQQWERRRSEFCRQVEGLLTPQQAAALKETKLHNRLDGLAQDRDLGKKLEITEEQKVRLRRASVAYGGGLAATYEEAKGKSLALLTEPQRQKLREELDRRGAW